MGIELPNSQPTIFSRLLLAFRNFVWNIRKRYKKDWLETHRTYFFCESYDLDNDARIKYYEEASPNAGWTDKVRWFKYGIQYTPFVLSEPNKYDRLIFPEMDCVMQYEEEGQLFSAHYYLDEKYQLHLRFFENAEENIENRTSIIQVYAHREIRPDYDALAHIRGKELTDGCELWHQIKKNLSA